MNGQFISFNNQSDFGDIVRIYRDCQQYITRTICRNDRSKSKSCSILGEWKNSRN